MLFTSFITFTYIPFIRIRSLLLGVYSVVTLSVTGTNLSGRQVGYIVSLCSSLQYCTYIAVRFYMHSGTLHCLLPASCFWLASCFMASKRKKQRKTCFFFLFFLLLYSSFFSLYYFLFFLLFLVLFLLSF